MGSDKLNLTARAAGFAMAYDETVGGPYPKLVRSGLPVVAPVRPDAASTPSQALTVTKNAKATMTWSLMGWSFGKTA